MKKLTLALVLMGSTAMAQDVAYSDDATLSCLSGEHDLAANLTCAGRSADLCSATPAGGTTVGITACLEREWQFWDRMLNELYGARIAEAKVSDAERENFGQPLASEADALRDMQRAWIRYRDAACVYARTQWGGGTGGGPAVVACLMQLTAQQALYLEHTRVGG